MREKLLFLIAWFVKKVKSDWLTISALNYSISDNYLNKKLDNMTKCLLKQYQLSSKINIEDVMHDILLHQYLCLTINQNYVLECFLVRIRQQVLNANTNSVANWQKITHLLVSALAYQSQINQYIWPVSSKELDDFQEIKKQLCNEEFTSFWAFQNLLLSFAMYQSLVELPDVIKQKLIKNIHTYSYSLQILIQQSLLYEQQINLSVQAIKQISCPVDANHQQVQAQYEINPYPLWQEVPPVFPKNFQEYFLTHYPQTYTKQLTCHRSVKVLVVGCGTGKQFFETSLNYKDADIIGIDLSKKSLACAQLKLSEQNIKNVTLLQADLFNLSVLAQQFDLIEAVGVLHHVASFEQGLAALITKLKPHGVILLGLYSAVARQDINQVKKYIVERHDDASLESIRKLRVDCMQLDKFQSLKYYQDFYYLTGMRDMLFHPHEQQFTLPEIKTHLTKNGLHFLGFRNIDKQTQKTYLQLFPEDIALANLDNWHQYELAYPQTFRGLYQFYCQKKEESSCQNKTK